MTIVHQHTGINAGGQAAPSAVSIPTVLTPKGTLAVLEQSIAAGPVDATTGKLYIEVDALVLEWLISDSRVAHEMRDLIGCVAEYRAMPCASLRQRMVNAAMSVPVEPSRFDVLHEIAGTPKHGEPCPEAPEFPQSWTDDGGQYAIDKLHEIIESARAEIAKLAGAA